MKNLFAVSVCLWSVVGVSSSFAANKAPPLASKVPPASSFSNGGYGVAGCGVGSMVFKENDATQILAATTNATFIQTFAMTFGTSNCGSAAKLVSKERVENYVAANENALKNEISRGNGEALNGLITLMGIQDEATFKENLKSSALALSKATPKEFTDSIYKL